MGSDLLIKAATKQNPGDEHRCLQVVPIPAGPAANAARAPSEPHSSPLISLLGL